MLNSFIVNAASIILLIKQSLNFCFDFLDDFFILNFLLISNFCGIDIKNFAAKALGKATEHQDRLRGPGRNVGTLRAVRDDHFGHRCYLGAPTFQRVS